MIKVLGLITARGGSKGIPKKNLAPVAGKPLIGWTLEAAAASHCLNRTIVSTDDAKIASLCRDWGMEVPFIRPPSLAQDDSSHIPVVLHALEWLAGHDQYKPDYIMLLQPTSPLRTAGDIDAAVELAQDKKAPAVISVTEAHDHSYLVRKLNSDGSLSAFTSCDVDYPRRQSLPKAYALNGAIYLTRCDVLTSARTFEPVGTLPYIMPP
jgi:CMP-N,N'-diacetyllegionaminic acid synthase